MFRFTILTTLVFGLLWGAVAVALNVGVLLSPGEQLVYSSKHSARQWDLHLLDLERGLHVNLTGRYLPDIARNRYPVWSPDGEYLVFASDLPRNSDLILLHLATGRLRYVTDWRWDDTFPDWAGGGTQRIAYVTSTGSNWDIGIVDLGLRDVPELASTGSDRLAQDRFIFGSRGDEYAPRWSPDGRYLLYQSNRSGINDLYLSTPDGSTARLTNGLMVVNGGVWSPDGERIAFAGGRSGAREVYMLRLDDGTLVNASKSPHDDYHPVWSPDGTRLVFVSDRDGDDELYLLDVAGDTDMPLVAQQLTDNIYPDYEPQWSPDGTRLVYVAAPGRTSELYLMDMTQPAGSADSRRLTFNVLEDWRPVWRPMEDMP